MTITTKNTTFTLKKFKKPKSELNHSDLQKKERCVIMDMWAKVEKLVELIQNYNFFERKFFTANENGADITTICNIITTLSKKLTKILEIKEEIEKCFDVVIKLNKKEYCNTFEQIQTITIGRMIPVTITIE